MGDRVLIQFGRMAIGRNEALAFAIAFFISASFLLYLFRFWFAVYVILFFVSAWTLVSISSERRKLRAIMVGYFSGYALSAAIGFLFLGIE